MGMQGPLTAQALGRSPYDEVVDGEGQDDSQQPIQQYDHRGRPINPDTKRMNRDIIRAHNEVMLVIGVAEPENPFSGPEAESQRRHEAHEEAIGLRLGFTARACVEAVGIFGIHGLRQRILIYKRYSHIPFWGLFKQAKTDFSISRDVLAGAPASMVLYYLDEEVRMLWLNQGREVARRIIHKAWSYVKFHLEIHVVLQRTGFMSRNAWFPQPSFFIPFTEASPIPAPPPLRDYTIPSLLSWVGGALISSTPFLVWVMTQHMLRDLRPQIWSQIYRRLPNTSFQRKMLLQQNAISPPPPPPPPPNHINLPSPDASLDPNNARCESSQGELETINDPLPGHNDETAPSGRPGQETLRQASVLSARGDEYPSDDEENEGVSATLISFDVEASESQDAPPGLWSAELRPSAGPDARSGANQQPVYMDTLLTRLPPLMATNLFTDAAMRILMVPYEATALRLVARMSRLRQGLPCGDLFNVNLLGGVTSTLLVNFLGAELLNVALSSEVWAAFTLLFQWYHMTEDEWKEEEEEEGTATQ
ncbi:hypothetical protein E4U43_007454 [Claviceps pusilla]|uniref:Uncharacterized protein n=1 Tax=Claviceps pusilla TaxID=123648 RepID=A0A9P7NCS7_9HYPO|nr:hypothetical protein E4U43_007454 [Claviceps pusilla]